MRAGAEAALLDLENDLSTGSVTAAGAMLAARISRFLNRSALDETAGEAPPPIPPGSPIGAFGTFGALGAGHADCALGAAQIGAGGRQ